MENIIFDTIAITLIIIVSAVFIYIMIKHQRNYDELVRLKCEFIKKDIKEYFEKNGEKL